MLTLLVSAALALPGAHITLYSDDPNACAAEMATGLALGWYLPGDTCEVVPTALAPDVSQPGWAR